VLKSYGQFLRSSHTLTTLDGSTTLIYKKWSNFVHLQKLRGKYVQNKSTTFSLASPYVPVFPLSLLKPSTLSSTTGPLLFPTTATKCLNLSPHHLCLSLRRPRLQISSLSPSPSLPLSAWIIDLVSASLHRRWWLCFC